MWVFPAGRHYAERKDVFEGDTTERQAGDNDGDANFDDGPYLRLVISIGHIFKVDLNDIGYANNTYNNVTV